MLGDELLKIRIMHGLESLLDRIETQTYLLLLPENLGGLLGQVLANQGIQFLETFNTKPLRLGFFPHIMHSFRSPCNPNMTFPKGEKCSLVTAGSSERIATRPRQCRGYSAPTSGDGGARMASRVHY